MCTNERRAPYPQPRKLIVIHTGQLEASTEHEPGPFSEGHGVNRALSL